VKEVAPDGAVWMCGACGKQAKDPMKIGDVSCYTWSVLVDEKSIVRHPDGAVAADAWKGEVTP
jgi:hypothetical protein